VKTDLRFILGVAAATVLGLTGCPADDSGETAADEGTTSSVDTDTSPSTTASGSATTASGSASATTTSPSTTDGTTTEMTTSVTDTMPTSTTNTEPQPNGAMCMSNEECESEMCFLAGILGGLCSSCLTDADCEWGCGLPNPLVDPPLGAECTMGMLGEGCDTAEACMDKTHVCALIIDVPGVLSASTCSECESTADCMNDMVCNVSISIETISGQKTCIEPNTVEDGGFCDLEGPGDEACVNYCGTADIGGLATFGVCGQCNNESGEGCEAGQKCEPPTVDLDGTVVPSMCV
jgi:hypothetical protein